MATITQRPKVEVTATFTLDEEELRALEHMTQWGVNSLMYALRKLSLSEFAQHEPAITRWFGAIREKVPGILTRADDARKAFNGEKVS
jgi:hypothetical protein